MASKSGRTKRFGLFLCQKAPQATKARGAFAYPQRKAPATASTVRERDRLSRSRYARSYTHCAIQPKDHRSILGQSQQDWRVLGMDRNSPPAWTRLREDQWDERRRPSRVISTPLRSNSRWHGHRPHLSQPSMREPCPPTGGQAETEHGEPNRRPRQQQVRRTRSFLAQSQTDMERHRQAQRQVVTRWQLPFNRRGRRSRHRPAKQALHPQRR